MKDIDFDELDRAVTSLLGKSSGGDSVPSPRVASPSQSSQHTVPTQPQSASAVPVQPKPQPQQSPSREPMSQTPSIEPESRLVQAPSQTQITKPAITALQKPAPKPSAIAKPEELGTNNTKFPITPATPSRPPKTATPPTRNMNVSGQPAQNTQNRRPSGRFMDFVQPSALSGSNGAQAPSTSLAARAPKPSPAKPIEGIKPPDPVTKKPEAPLPLKQESERPQQQNPLAVNRPSRASHIGKAVTPPEESSRSLDDLVPRKPRTETPEVSNDEKPAKSSFVSSLLGKKNDDALIEEKAASHPEATSARKQTEDIPSPFLTDTKVAKRPLGSAVKPSTAQRIVTEEEPVNASSPMQEEETNGQLVPKPTSLPPELGQDIVAVEARDPHASNRPDTPPAYPPEKEDTPRPQKAPITTANTASQAAHTATLSIPQQYRAKQATPDKTPRSIYDTEEYHTPLPTAAAKKKKSHPVVWVFVVILLLALGAGLGVAVYFLFG